MANSPSAFPWMDETTPNQAVFKVPFLVNPASTNGDELDQLLNAMEVHVSRVKLSRFFSSVAAGFPSGVDALSLSAQVSYDSGDRWVEVVFRSYSRAPGGGWKEKELGNDGVGAVLALGELFPQDARADEEEKVLGMVEELPHPMTPEQFQDLALRVWPPEVRSCLAFDNLERQVSNPSPARSPSPRF